MNRSRLTFRGAAVAGLCLAAAAAAGVLVAAGARPSPAAPNGGERGTGNREPEASLPVPCSPFPVPGFWATAALPPFAAAPAPSRSSTLVPAPLGWWLPPAEVRSQPRGLLAGEQSAPRVRPAADVPPLAADSARSTPQPARLPAGPLASGPSPDPAAVPVMPTRGVPGPDRPGASSDPTEESSRQSVLAAPQAFRRKLAPFLRLVIPNPFETTDAIELRQAPPDNAPPISATALPSKPTLPAKP